MLAEPAQSKTRFAYGVFISYSTQDRVVAGRVQRELERFRIPRSLRGAAGRYGVVPASLGRVFVDRTDLSAAPHITDEIRNALERSEALVVLCSRAAAEPKSWVNREIAAFRTLRPDGRVFAMIVADEPPSCFPSELLKAQADASPSEPLAADFRSEGDGPREALVKLCAGLLGIDFDVLRRRRLEAERRRRLAVVAIGGFYAASITGALIWVGSSYLDIRQSRRSAIAQQAKVANDAGRHDLALLFSAVALTPNNSLIETSPPTAEAQATRALLNNRLKRQIYVRPAEIMALDAERRRAFIAQFGKTLRALDLDAGSSPSAWRTTPDKVFAVALSRDGRNLAVGVEDGGVVLLDAQTGDERLRTAPTGFSIRSLAFSRTGSLLVAGDESGVARVLEVASGRWISISPKHEGFVGGVGFSFDENRVLSGSFGSSLMEWDSRSGVLVREHEKKGTVVRIGTFAQGMVWATAFALRKAVLLKSNFLTMNDREIPLAAAASDIAATSDGRFFGAATWTNKSVEIIEATSARTIASLAHPEWVDSVSFLDGDRSLVTLARDGFIRFWDNPGSVAPRQAHRFAKGGVTQVAWATKGQVIATGGGAPVLIDVFPGGGPTKQLPLEGCLDANAGCYVKSLAVSADGRRALFGTSDGLLALYDLESGAHLWSRRVPNGQTVQSVAFHPDGKQVAARLLRGTFEIYSIDDGASVSTFQVETPDFVNDKSMSVIAFDPTGTYVAETPEYRIQIRRLSDNAVVWDANVVDRTGVSIAWSLDGRTLAVGTAGDTIRLYAPFETSQPTVLRGHKSWVRSLSWSPDSRYLLATSPNDTIIWDVGGGEEVARIDPEGRSPSAAAFDRDGKTIVVSDTSGYVRSSAFDPPTGDLHTRVCEGLPEGGRTFTTVQMREYSFLRPSEANPCAIPPFLSGRWATELIEDVWRGATSAMFTAKRQDNAPAK